MNFTLENARSFALDLFNWASCLGGNAFESARRIYEDSGFSCVIPFDAALRTTDC